MVDWNKKLEPWQVDKKAQKADVERFHDFVEKFNKMVKADPNWMFKCPRCKKKMVHPIDKKTGKKDKYAYYCPCNPKVGLFVG